MKKKHSWANSIPKFNREKDLLSIANSPTKLAALNNLLSSARKVTDNLGKIENDKFNNIDELVSFVSTHLSDDFPNRSTLLEELNLMMERYEERNLSDTAVSESATV